MSAVGVTGFTNFNNFSSATFLFSLLEYYRYLTCQRHGSSLYMSMKFGRKSGSVNLSIFSARHNTRQTLMSEEKRIGTSEDTTNPTTHEEGEIPTHHEEDAEGEVHEVGEMVTTTGDVDVVEEETHFNSASAQILIREIMVYNQDLEMVKQKITDVQKKMTNVIDVLGRI
ncbi:hypothetical protein AB205_0197860 [Aquarana catesbeiana]|uniref:Uncharacterized protein n=2 Tax=Aquarana catesbeiana TaxID=8400 RepID=A0A2G9R8Y4_AQUCT|nr:hypothetical protein AB205_0197860 [Aquarana catesbeiana]